MSIARNPAAAISSNLRCLRSLLGWTLSLSHHYQWLSDGITKSTNVHDDGLSPSVMKALVTETQRKSFFLFSVSLCLRGNFLSRQRRDFLFLRALCVLRGSIVNTPKRGVGPSKRQSYRTSHFPAAKCPKSNHTRSCKRSVHDHQQG